MSFALQDVLITTDVNGYAWTLRQQLFIRKADAPNISFGIIIGHVKCSIYSNNLTFYNMNSNKNWNFIKDIKQILKYFKAQTVE